MSSPAIARTSKLADIKVSTYDRVSAGLWALILIFGVLALIVVMMWLQLQSKKRAGADQMLIVPILAPGEIGEDKPLGIGDDAEDPGVEDFPEVEIPQLADAVEAVTDAPSRVRGMLAAVDGTEVEMGKGRGLGSRGGGGGGGGGGSAERWSIEYESENYPKYLEQITSFGVEIGFVSKVTDQVEIIYDLTTEPKIRTTTKIGERRVFFIHANSKLRQWDQRVSQSAGVKLPGKIMCQFYPKTVTARLAALEAAEAQRRGMQIAQIKRTLFKVRDAGGNFEYYVADIIPK